MCDTACCADAQRDQLVGAITFTPEVRPFTDKQIELVRTLPVRRHRHRERAVLNELRQRTTDLASAQPTSRSAGAADRDIGGAPGRFSSSPGDLAASVRAMLEKAVRICDANFGTMYLREEGRLRLIAAHNVPARLPKYAQDGAAQTPRRVASLTQ